MIKWWEQRGKREKKKSGCHIFHLRPGCCSEKERKEEKKGGSPRRLNISRSHKTKEEKGEGKKKKRKKGLHLNRPAPTSDKRRGEKKKKRGKKKKKNAVFRFCPIPNLAQEVKAGRGKKKKERNKESRPHKLPRSDHGEKKEREWGSFLFPQEFAGSCEQPNEREEEEKKKKKKKKTRTASLRYYVEAPRIGRRRGGGGERDRFFQPFQIRKRVVWQGGEGKEKKKRHRRPAILRRGIVEPLVDRKREGRKKDPSTASSAAKGKAHANPAEKKEKGKGGRPSRFLLLLVPVISSFWAELTREKGGKEEGGKRKKKKNNPLYPSESFYAFFYDPRRAKGRERKRGENASFHRLFQYSPTIGPKIKEKKRKREGKRKTCVTSSLHNPAAGPRPFFANQKKKRGRGRKKKKKETLVFRPIQPVPKMRP